MLGAAIVLPDHPQIAPESRGNLFDNTEIEEALVLHVQALSDEERAQLEHQDPAVKEMIERARAVTPEELLRLHGRVEVRDPVTREPPQPSADVRDPTRGLPEVEVDGVTFRRGGQVVVRPGLDADLQARMLEGRTVTIERIYRDYDDKVHIGVERRPARPGDHARDRPFPMVLPPGVGGGRVKQVLVAGIGNAWLKDDGFGGEVVKRLNERELPPEGGACSTSAPAASTSPTRSCAATTRSC